jgi:hypothetical protein
MILLQQAGLVLNPACSCSLKAHKLHELQHCRNPGMLQIVKSRIAQKHFSLSTFLKCSLQVLVPQLAGTSA